MNLCKTKRISFASSSTKETSSLRETFIIAQKSLSRNFIKIKRLRRGKELKDPPLKKSMRTLLDPV